MEKQSEHFDDLTRKLVKEGGMHSPSPDFLENVMQKIRPQDDTSRVYRPLISSKGWMICVLVALASFALLYWFPSSEVNWGEKLSIANYVDVQSPFKGLEISKTFIYGIGFMSLFLLQIPFLKNYLQKQYK